MNYGAQAQMAPPLRGPAQRAVGKAVGRMVDPATATRGAAGRRREASSSLDSRSAAPSTDSATSATHSAGALATELTAHSPPRPLVPLLSPASQGSRQRARGWRAARSPGAGGAPLPRVWGHQQEAGPASAAPATRAVLSGPPSAAVAVSPGTSPAAGHDCRSRSLAVRSVFARQQAAQSLTTAVLGPESPELRNARFASRSISADLTPAVQGTDQGSPARSSGASGFSSAPWPGAGEEEGEEEEAEVAKGASQTPARDGDPPQSQRAGPDGHEHRCTTSYSSSRQLPALPLRVAARGGAESPRSAPQLSAGPAASFGPQTQWRVTALPPPRCMPAESLPGSAADDGEVSGERREEGTAPRHLLPSGSISMDTGATESRSRLSAQGMWGSRLLPQEQESQESKEEEGEESHEPTGLHGSLPTPPPDRSPRAVSMDDACVDAADWAGGAWEGSGEASTKSTTPSDAKARLASLQHASAVSDTSTSS